MDAAKYWVFRRLGLGSAESVAKSTSISQDPGNTPVTLLLDI